MSGKIATRCSYCAKKVGRGKALCMRHWMLLSNFHRAQIGRAMQSEKARGDGPDENGIYHSGEYIEAVSAACAMLRAKEASEPEPEPPSPEPESAEPDPDEVVNA